MTARLQMNTVVTRLVGWAASVFYVLECQGEPIPDGPVLVVANHPNSLLDPLIIFRAAGRPTRPLAKAPLFDQMFVGGMLRALGGLPVYRRQDDATQMHRNDETFRRAIDALRTGDAVQIYPEGMSHSEPGLVPLRTGAARIALGAEAESGWSLGLRVVPVGITYRRKSLFRGRALARMGAPFDIQPWQSLHVADPGEAVRALTEEIAHRLQAETLALTNSEDQALIETAEALYTREKGLSGWRERDQLSERLPRLQEFARGLAWLRANDTPRFQKLATRVRRYGRVLRLLGVSDGDVPPRYTFTSVLRYALREAPLLLIGVPLAAVGALLWYLPYLAPRLVTRLVAPEHEAIATYKLATAFFVMPLWWLLCTALGWWSLGPIAGVIALAAVPLLGFLALYWRERWHRVREDALLFLRVLRHPRRRDRLAALRAGLAAEFDRVLEEKRAAAATTTTGAGV